MNKRKIQEQLEIEIQRYDYETVEKFEACVKFDAQKFITSLIESGFVFKDENSVELADTLNARVDSFITDYYFREIVYLEATEELFTA